MVVVVVVWFHCSVVFILSSAYLALQFYSPSPLSHRPINSAQLPLVHTNKCIEFISQQLEWKFLWLKIRKSVWNNPIYWIFTRLYVETTARSDSNSAKNKIKRWNHIYWWNRETDESCRRHSCRFLYTFSLFIFY